MLATSGTAGVIVGALQETFERSGAKRGRSYAIVAPAAAGLAAANIWRVRRAAHADADLPPEESQASMAKSIAYGLGIAGAMSALGAGERKFADKIAQGLARVLPGNEALWRPVGHAASLAALGFGTRFLAEKMLHRIETVQESMDAAFDIAPPDENVSGSYESLVPVRHAVARGPPLRVDDHTARRDQRRDGRGGHEDSHPRVRRARQRRRPRGPSRVDDAGTRTDERVRAFVVAGRVADRHRLRQLRRGLDHGVPLPRRLRNGRDAVLGPTVAALARSRRRRAPANSEADGALSANAWSRSRTANARRSSSSARASARGRARTRSSTTGRRGSSTTGVDYAIWIGTPNFSKWKERVLYDDGPEIDRSLIGVFNDIDEWNATPAAEREAHPVRDDHALRRRRGGVRAVARDPGARVARATRDAPGAGAEGHALGARQRPSSKCSST